MISGVLFMCLTNIISISSSNMNNSPSSSSNNNNEADNAKESLDKILDVIFDYNGNGDDELTLRFDKRIFYKETFVFFFADFSFRRGNKLEVLSTDESISGSRGWWTGRLIDTNSVGIFPANFVANSQTNLRIINFNDLQIGETIGVGGFG